MQLIIVRLSLAVFLIFTATGIGNAQVNCIAAQRRDMRDILVPQKACVFISASATKATYSIEMIGVRRASQTWNLNEAQVKVLHSDLIKAKEWAQVAKENRVGTRRDLPGKQAIRRSVAADGESLVAYTYEFWAADNGANSVVNISIFNSAIWINLYMDRDEYDRFASLLEYAISATPKMIDDARRSQSNQGLFK